MLKTNQKNIKKDLLDSEKSQKIIRSAIYIILSIIAAVMTLMNVFTHKGLLTVATGLFSVLCAMNLLLSLSEKRTLKNASDVLFSIELICMFSFFLISGNPEGFSAIWICLVPPFSMMFFGRRKGSFFSIAMFFVLFFFLWLPLGNSFLQYHYTNSFRMRFPVLYLSDFSLAYFIETMRQYAHEEMVLAEEKYKSLSMNDALTGISNRQGMYFRLKDDPVFSMAKKVGIIMLDIDFFKAVNDNYGHTVGDTVLKEFASLLEENIDGIVCRWGGEEFVGIYTDENRKREDFERLRQTIEEYTFDRNGSNLKLTSSIGICEISDFDPEKIDTLIGYADMALYQAKRTGRNKIIYFYPENTLSKTQEN